MQPSKLSKIPLKTSKTDFNATNTSYIPVHNRDESLSDLESDSHENDHVNLS